MPANPSLKRTISRAAYLTGEIRRKDGPQPSEATQELLRELYGPAVKAVQAFQAFADAMNRMVKP